MSKRNKSITVKMNFTEDDLNTILDAANFGDGDSMTVADVIKAGRWEEFKKELTDTPFKDEVMDGTREACANDWMCDFDHRGDDDDQSVPRDENGLLCPTN